MTHLEILTYITLMLMDSEDETRINQENYGKKMWQSRQTNLITNQHIYFRVDALSANEKVD